MNNRKPDQKQAKQNTKPDAPATARPYRIYFGRASGRHDATAAIYFSINVNE
jgi:hypothetical protein